MVAHYWTYFVQQVWPNLLAQIIWTIPAAGLFIRHHMKMVKKLTGKHVHYEMTSTHHEE